MTTSFEDSFLAAYDAAKPAQPRIKIGADQKYVSFSTDMGEYQFSHRDPRKGGWQGGGTINIYGPTFGRTGNMKSPMSFLGSFNLGTGKLTYAVSDKITKGNTEYALDLFLRKHGNTSSGLFGWSVNLDTNGWGRITIPPSAKRKFHKEIAVFGAEMPGRKIQFYTPDGKKKLTYEQRAKIPGEVVTYIASELQKAGIWSDLSRSYNTINASNRYPEKPRTVNTWEDGPGEKYFPKSGLMYGAHGVSKTSLTGRETVAEKAKRLAVERYHDGYKAGVAATRRSGSTIDLPRKAEVNNDFRRGYRDGVLGIKSR